MKKNHTTNQSINQSNISDISDISDTDRVTRPVYVSRSVIEGFIKYAKSTSEGVAHHLENALIEYVENHPLENKPILIQRQISSVLPRKLDYVNMNLLEPQITSLVNKIREEPDAEMPELKSKLAKLIKKGVYIKHPSEEFASILEEAVKHI